MNPDGTYDPKTNTYTTGTGQVLTGVHSRNGCARRPCVVHAPSDHPLRGWPTCFRDGGSYDVKPAHMERICPHGIGHPDPDDLGFHGGAIAIHGCDGCCAT